LNEIKQCLGNNLPVVIGFLVYSSFESQMTAQTGYVQLPNPLTEPLLGGHAVMVIGYDDLRQVVIFQNSWGPTWGSPPGIGYLPYAFVNDPNLTSDCHAFTQVEVDRTLNPKYLK
jgi:C1A family cysteine protease